MLKVSKILLFLILCMKTSSADVGGHDLFTSLAQLEVLWQNEMEVVKVMKDTIEKLHEASSALEA